MVLGHYGLALGAKNYARRTSLGTLVLAAQLADLVWPVLLLLGVERASIVPANPPTLRLDFVSYPFTHSLATGIVAGLVFGLLYKLIRKDNRGAIAVALLVPSHWILDVMVHLPDLCLWPGGPKVGLGAWRSLPLTLLLEAFFFIAGLLIYVRATRAKDATGKYAFWAFVTVLVLGYASAIAGPAPKDITSVAYSCLILWLFVPWAYWIDRHRTNAATDEA
jgi:hypothetical protein